MAPTNAAFANGTALVKARTENTPAWATPASVSKSVKFFWGKK